MFPRYVRNISQELLNIRRVRVVHLLFSFVENCTTKKHNISVDRQSTGPSYTSPKLKFQHKTSQEERKTTANCFRTTARVRRTWTHEAWSLKPFRFVPAWLSLNLQRKNGKFYWCVRTLPTQTWTDAQLEQFCPHNSESPKIPAGGSQLIQTNNTKKKLCHFGKFPTKECRKNMRETSDFQKLSWRWF